MEHFPDLKNFVCQFGGTVSPPNWHLQVCVEPVRVADLQNLVHPGVIGAERTCAEIMWVTVHTHNMARMVKMDNNYDILIMKIVM